MTTKIENQTEEATSVLEELAAKSKNLRYAAQAEEGVIAPGVLAELLGIRPQMVYNYMSKGKIKNVTSTVTQKKVIALEDAEAFAAGYLARKVEREAKIDEELNGTSE